MLVCIDIFAIKIKDLFLCMLIINSRREAREPDKLIAEHIFKIYSLKKLMELAVITLSYIILQPTTYSLKSKQMDYPSIPHFKIW